MCCYTNFSRKGRDGMEIDLRLSGDQIPYNPRPVFLGITFDEKLSFNPHFENLRTRALKRLNIIKIFSHRSWHLNSKTLTNIYRALIGSIFDYSFFAVAVVSDRSLGLIQRVQNRALRCIFKLKWDSPTKDLFPASGVLFLRERFLQLGARYTTKSIRNKNPFLSVLISEYIGSHSAITARGRTMSTPLCHFTFLMALALICLNFLKIIFYLFLYVI